MISALLSSCSEDKLALAPYNAVSDATVLSKEIDFTNAINGAYGYMVKRGGANGYGQELIIDSEVATDNVILSQEGRKSNLDGYRFTSTATNSHFDFYFAAYRSSYNANLVLEQLSKLPSGTFRDNIQGEALFIRALNHFELLRAYGQIPTQSSSALASLGVAYTTSSDVSLRPSRLTVQESYDKVLGDLNIAKNLIANNVVANGHPGKSAVYTLLSRAYLYLGDWANCISNANLAITSGAGVCPRTNFVNLWEDLNSSGVLFKARIDIVDASNPGVAYSQASGANTKSEYVITKELFDLYPATDIRKTTYIKVGPFGANIYNNIAKYDGRGAGTRNLVDVKILRLEEAYLNKAEAEFKLSGGGLASLDAVRSQRYLPFVSGGETGVALFNAINLERRLEFAFEMDRFYTLKRQGLPVNRSLTQGHLSSGLGTPSVAPFLAAGDFRWQFPIDQGDRDLNPNLQQNPGY